MSKDNIEAIYSLSPMQLGMLFHSIYNEQSRAYVVVLHFHLEGALNVPAFKTAWQRVIERHPVLRTFFLWENRENPLQIVRMKLELPIHEYDWSHLSGVEHREQVEKFTQEERNRGFHLSKAPLMRLSLIKAAPDSYDFIWTSHHILADGWSVSLLLKEAFTFYQATQRGEDLQIDTPTSYKEYISWIQKQDLSQAKEYWQEALQAFKKPTPLPYDTAPPGNQDLAAQYDKQVLRLSEKATASLQLFTQQSQITLNTLIQGVWALLLSRYSNENDVVFGAVVSGRSIAIRDIETMVGLFINTLPVRVQVSPEAMLVPWLREIQAQHVQARRFEYGSLRDIQSWSELSQARGASLFESILVFGGNHQMDNLLKGLDDELKVHNRGVLEGSHYPLTILVDPGDALQIRIVYDCQRFESASISRIGTHFKHLLESILANPDRQLSTFSVLTPSEEQQLIIDFNRTAAPVPAGKTVVQLFEEQVEQTPDALALRFKELSLTYAQLNSHANQLAHYLRRYGVGPEQVVAFCLDRSPEAIIAILGTLKAGGGYLPLDSTLPTSRLELMLEETAAPVILTNQRLAEKLPPAKGAVVRLDVDWLVIESEPVDNIVQAAEPKNLAYIIYTSGSTGKPKGAMVRHRNLLNYIAWAKDFYLQGQKLDFPLFSSLSFDLTVTSIFVPLISGGSIVIYGEGETPNLEIMDVIRDDQVDIIKLTPAHLTLLQTANLSAKRLRKMIVGGEDFKRNLAMGIHELFGGQVEIYNEYGPTEATVGCMIHRFDPRTDTDASVPIGRPIQNSQVYILDKNLQPVPPGVMGEMCIGGAGVARGYLHRPELTSSKFVKDPFTPGSTLYRTGDLARWTADGRMQFLGRSDHQVKIKGYRIELGEIESALLEHPEIEDVVATAFQPEIQSADKIKQRCVVCGLPDHYPGTTFDSAGVCKTCREFSELKDRFRDYFKTPADLQVILDHARQTKSGQYDCIVLYSGGKDSTYMLHQLVKKYDMQPLVFSMDNGYISEEAKENARRVTDALGVDLVFGQTPHMNAVFADSLKRKSNVCDGCFKVIYTLSINLAREKGIKYIFTGLSRGQLFETRLSDMFHARIFDVNEIDQTVLAARKAYHRVDDAVRQLMDVKVFESETIFDEVQLVDFYRYVDVPLSEVYRYLDREALWVRPSDTGRSTNCLINDVGIFIHKRERGFHNYALPYSWDVRMGHKTRLESIDELSDEIDENKVRRILKEVGYDENEKIAQRTEKRLVAYYVSSQAISPSALRQHLASRLPDYMIPADFIRLEQMPLTVNGKVDRTALPDPDNSRPVLESDHAAPNTEQERQLVKIWSQVFRLSEIGIHDNFFDLGGDSIISIQIVTKARQAGLHFTPRDLFEQQTIAQLARVLKKDQNTQAEQGLVTGTIPLSPIQRWFFEQNFRQPHHWNLSLWLNVPQDVDRVALQLAWSYLLKQHDLLRARFRQNAEGAWEQTIPAESVQLTMEFHDLSALPSSDQETALVEQAEKLESSLNLQTGPLLKAGLFALGHDRPLHLFVTCHHLVIDSVSWQPLLEDWETAYHQVSRGQTVQMSSKTTSFKVWAEKLEAFARQPALEKEIDYWRSHIPALDQPTRDNDQDPGSIDTVSCSLSERSTASLLYEVHEAYNTNVVDLLLTAWAQAFVDLTGNSTASVVLEGHGREAELIGDVDVSRTVGWFTTQHPLYIRLAEKGDLGSLLKQVKEQVRLVPNKGMGYGLLRYQGKENQLGAQPAPPVLFNYLGQFERALPASELFSLVKPLQAGNSPHNHPTHELEVNAYIRSGRMHVDIDFNTALRTQESVRALAEYFVTALEALIAHCLSPDAGGRTASDFALNNLTGEQFNRLSDLLDNLDDR